MPFPDWRDISYLAAGTKRQQQAYGVLITLDVLTILDVYDPVLVGTIPLDIDIPGSDLDIICHSEDRVNFQQAVIAAYGGQPGFQIKQTTHNGLPTIVANFEPAVTLDGQAVCLPVELFGQPHPVQDQNAYRHMVVEAHLLHMGGPTARAAIRALKEQHGLKTEPAFARYFGLTGDPYQRLLELADLDDEALRLAVTVD
ncbi:DUF4269 domain-containing protein [Chloroflexota bacterium]